MQRSLIKDNKVINQIELEEGADWKPPEGCFIGPEGGKKGDGWDPIYKEYIKPVIPELSDSEKAQYELQGLDNVLRRTDEDIIDVLIQHTPAKLADFGSVIEKNYNDKQAARIRRNA